nr:MAG TPA: hypothetical protein [Caudoviricetes sp.]
MRLICLSRYHRPFDFLIQQNRPQVRAVCRCLENELQNVSYYRFLHFILYHPYSGHRDKFTNDDGNTFSLCCR